MLTLPLLLACASAGLVGGLHCVGMCGSLQRLFRAAPAPDKLVQPNLHKADLGKPTGAVIYLHQPAQASAQAFAVPASVLPSSHQIYLHAGRLSLYGLLGAIVGGFGAASLQLVPNGPALASAQHWMFIIGNLSLILLAMRLLQWHRYLPSWPTALRFTPVQAFFHKHLHQRMQTLLAGGHALLARGKQHPFLLGMAWGCLPCGLLYLVLPFALFSASTWAGAVLMLVFGLCSLPHLLLVGMPSVYLRQSHWKYLAASLLFVLGGMGLWYADMQQMPAFLCVTAW